nr:hypothetical protein [Rhodococcus sp. (in: high G+C Gram-positive bacteria)]
MSVIFELVSTNIVGAKTVIEKGDAVVIRRAIVEIIADLIGQPYWSVTSERNGWPKIQVAPASGCAPKHYSVRAIE